MSIGIEPIAAPNAAQADQRQRYGAPFGAAVTYSELVHEALRVDPAAIAARMMAEPQRSEKPRQSVRTQRLAEEDAAYDARRDEHRNAHLGAHVDIKV